MANINVTIIVPSASVALARTLAAAQGISGEGMFERPVYTGGVVTDYISSGWINEVFANLLTDANALFESSQGQATLEQCQNLINTSVVSDCCTESPFSLLESLGKTI